MKMNDFVPSDEFLRAHSHETSRYYSLPGTNHYEYRVEIDDSGTMGKWQYGYPVTPDNLERLKKDLKDATYWEVRVVASVANADTGTYAGRLILTERIEGGTEFDPATKP